MLTPPTIVSTGREHKYTGQHEASGEEENDGSNPDLYTMNLDYGLHLSPVWYSIITVAPDHHHHYPPNFYAFPVIN